MPNTEPKNKCEITRYENDATYLEFQKQNCNGLRLVAVPFGEDAQLSMSADAGDFRKWLRQNQSSWNVESQKPDVRVDLHAADIWLPIVWLGENVALPVFLSLVSSYVYDKVKGDLRGDRREVHFKAVYKSKRTGVSQELSFQGSIDDLNRLKEKLRDE